MNSMSSWRISSTSTGSKTGRPQNIQQNSVDGVFVGILFYICYAMMLAEDLISSMIPPLTRRDSAAKALDLMNEFHLSHLPVVENEVYLFLLEESVLLDWDDLEMLLSNLTITPGRPAIRREAHFFEAIRLATDFKLSLVPVVGEHDLYIGAIPRENMLLGVAHFNGIQETGSLLILEVEPQDLMLSEITRLAEAEDIHIYGIYTYSDPASSALCVLIKTDRHDLSGYVATLERFRYRVAFRFDEQGEKDDLKKNYDLLMHYINM